MTTTARSAATSPVRIENVEVGHCESYWERECLVEDSILDRDLARSPIHAPGGYEHVEISV